MHANNHNAIPVFYTPAMVADSGSYSPSAAKPASVVASWQRPGRPLSIVPPQPLVAEHFGVAHDAAFVADILAGRRTNGFGNRSPEVAASLPLTSGAFLAAAREALRNGIGAVAPCSGFHHAGYDFAGGYQRDAEGGIRPVLDIHDSTMLAFAESCGLAAHDGLEKAA